MIAQELSQLLGGQPIYDYKEENAIKCPFHDDRHASASINIRKGKWNCQGCGKGGSLDTLARLLGGEINDLDFEISKAGALLSAEDEPVDLTEVYNRYAIIQPTTPEALKYARAKRLRIDTLQDFGIRYNNRGVLCMPYFAGNRIAALRYRGLNGEKWSEHGSERVLYNVNEAKGKSTVIICEGESDTHAIWNYLRGNGNTDVAVIGSPGAMSSVRTWEIWSIDLVWAESIFIAFDNDEAGEKGFERANSVLGDKAIRLAPPKQFNDWSDAIVGGTGLNMV